MSTGWQCLCDMKKILDENNQEFFLAYGTLLGCVRNNDFIPYDNDIDIGIFYDNFDINIINKIKESKLFRVASQCGDIENGFEITFIHTNNVPIDIFIYYKIKDNYYYCTSFDEKIYFEKGNYCTVWGQCYKWGHTIKGLISFPFKSSHFLIPSNFEEYLEESYGKDWKIPKSFSYEQGIVNNYYKNLINKDTNPEISELFKRDRELINE